MCRSIGKLTIFLFGLILVQVPLFFGDIRAHHHACHVQSWTSSTDRIWCALGADLLSPIVHSHTVPLTGTENQLLVLPYESPMALASRVSKDVINHVIHLYAFISWDWVILTYHELYWQNAPAAAICMQLTGIHDQIYWQTQPDVCRARIFDQVNKLILGVQLMLYLPVLAYTLWWHMFLSQRKQLRDLIQTTDQLKVMLEVMLRERQIVYLHDAVTTKDTKPMQGNATRQIVSAEET